MNAETLVSKAKTVKKEEKGRGRGKAEGSGVEGKRTGKREREKIPGQISTFC